MDERRSKLIELAVKAEIPDSKIKAALQVLQGDEKPAIEADKYDSVKGICEYLAGCSRVHLWQLRKRGLPSHSIGGRLGFKRRDVDLWLASQKEKVK